MPPPEYLAGLFSLAADTQPSDGVTVIAYGRPAPQGSKRYVGHSKRTGNAVLVEMSRHVKPWRTVVHDAARAVIDATPGFVPLDGPLSVGMVFTIARPQRPKYTTAPAVAPDLSKLARSTEDALTDARLWADDARVVEYTRLAKVFPLTDPDALGRPGVLITITPIGGGRLWTPPPTPP